MLFSRRYALVNAVAAQATSPALSDAPATGAQDPHAHLWAEHEAAFRLCGDEAAERADSLLRQICETPAETPAGLAVQAAALAWMIEVGQWSGDIDLNLADGLARLAGRAHS